MTSLEFMEKLYGSWN